tara:strand:+ start:38 stop:388 length:351 start_codon:yes stop_codon:yes gene_type:complete
MIVVVENKFANLDQCYSYQVLVNRSGEDVFSVVLEISPCGSHPRYLTICKFLDELGAKGKREDVTRRIFLGLGRKLTAMDLQTYEEYGPEPLDARCDALHLDFGCPDDDDDVIEDD